MRLLGLVWGRASHAVIVKAARELASAQGSDGGWAQLQGLPPDAYATRHALVALRESGFFGPAAKLSESPPSSARLVDGNAPPKVRL
jgi:hypothetical protein